MKRYTLLQHEGFDESTLQDNVAMLFLSPDANTNKRRIEPIDEVATDEYFKKAVFGNLQCKITGWGQCSDSGICSLHLLTASRVL